MIDLQKDINLNFIFYYLKKLNLNQFIFGSGQPLITGTQLKGIQIPLPPLPEQTAIATALSDMDTEIQTLESKLQKLKLQKQGMMQALLTGKIRLV
jgi:type I restriction enzyme S subunit